MPDLPDYPLPKAIPREVIARRVEFGDRPASDRPSGIGTGNGPGMLLDIDIDPRCCILTPHSWRHHRGSSGKAGQAEPG